MTTIKGSAVTPQADHGPDTNCYYMGRLVPKDGSIIFEYCVTPPGAQQAGGCSSLMIRGGVLHVGVFYFFVGKNFVEFVTTAGPFILFLIVVAGWKIYKDTPQWSEYVVPSHVLPNKNPECVAALVSYINDVFPAPLSQCARHAVMSPDQWDGACVNELISGVVGAGFSPDMAVVARQELMERVNNSGYNPYME